MKLNTIFHNGTQEYPTRSCQLIVIARYCNGELRSHNAHYYSSSGTFRIWGDEGKEPLTPYEYAWIWFAWAYIDELDKELKERKGEC